LKSTCRITGEKADKASLASGIIGADICQRLPKLDDIKGNDPTNACI
jgi:hypothetical protein